MMENLFGFAVISLLGLDVIFIIISLAIDYWVYADNANLKLYAGLWESCSEFKANSLKACVDLPDDNNDYNTVRAMLFLALFLVIGAIVCMIIKLFVKKDNKVVLYAATGCLAVAGLFLMIGFGVFHAEIYKPGKDQVPGTSLHAGFAFCIISWILTWGLTGALVVMVLKNRQDTDLPK